MTTTQNRPPEAGRRRRMPVPLPQEAGTVSDQESRQVAEAARETEWRKPSFGKELFLGRFRLDLIDPWPQPDPIRTAKAEEFLAEARRVRAHRGRRRRRSSATPASPTRCSTAWPSSARSA